MKQYFLAVFVVAALTFSGCAQFPETEVGESGSRSSLQRSAEEKLSGIVPLWQKEVDQLELLGDYNGACRVLRKRYLRSPDHEIGDRFSLLLSYLSDEQVAEWWLQESDSELSCRVTAEYFLRCRRQSGSDLPSPSETLLLELARKLSSDCDVTEDLRVEAQDFILLHQALSGKAEVTVGCLLPLSGPNAASGERFLRGMELALGVYPESFAGESSAYETVKDSPELITVAKDPQLDVPENRSLPGLRLLLYDTAGEGERARVGVRYLAQEKNVDLLLGPYTGKAANYAAAEAQSIGVTMISLSPLLRNLERYPNVFQHYPTIRNQAHSLAALAMTRLGLKDFALLVPKNQYGRDFAESFTAQATAWGGEIVRQVYYDSSLPDFGPAIRELIGVEHYRRFKEKRQEYEAWLKEQQSVTVEEGEDEDKLAQLAREIGIEDEGFGLLETEDIVMPRPLLDCDFEAIVIPDRAQTLELLIPQLAFYDLEESFLLGGRYWNSEELLKAAAEYADGAIFVDALCMNCEDVSAELIDFRERFMALYKGEVPGLLELYGFDTIMLVRKLSAEMGSEVDPETWRQALVDCLNLPLASGLTSTLGDGEIAKQLYPLTFKRGKIEIVSGLCR